MIWSTHEKINVCFKWSKKISVCVCCKVVKTTCARAREEGMWQYCKRRRTAHTTRPKRKNMYISKREQKRRLQRLWHMSTEEQMQEYYLHQERRAYKSSTTDERHIFDMCKGSRTKKRVKNAWSSEQAGTCGSYTHTMRFENSYITKVCKSRNLY